MKVETWHRASTRLLSELNVRAIKVRNITHQKDLPVQFKYRNVLFTGTDQRLLLCPLFHVIAFNVF